MGINSRHLRKLVVAPTLKKIGLHSEAAENLILGTIAQESHMGEYLRQLGGGPAVGICQMEPATLNDIYDNFLKYRPSLRSKLDALQKTQGKPTPEDLISNLDLSVALCRVHYFRVKYKLPEARNTVALAHYWKDHYNTHKGAGTPEEFIQNYKRFVR